MKWNIVKNCPFLFLIISCFCFEIISACMRSAKDENSRWWNAYPGDRPVIIYRSRKVLLPTVDLPQDAAIAVNAEGKISKIMTGDDAVKYADANKVELLDFGTWTISPGVVDSHVHVNEPGRTSWEGYSSATRAAAAGGITTIVDMPLNSIPPTTTVANLQTKLDAALGKTHVDVAFWGGVIPGNEADLKPLVAAGVRGFKCFTAPSGVDEFPSVSRADLEKALTELQDTSSVLLYHAELESASENAMENGQNKTSEAEKHQDPEKYETYLESKPQSMEVNAIKMIIDLTEKYKVRSHIVHLSAADALPELREARNKKHLPLSVETCHHYLTLAAENIPDNHTEYKCSPPIREQKNQELLWSAIRNKDIDMVVSDHSPSTADLKGLCCDQRPDFMKAWGGIASVQFGLSLLYTGAIKHGMSLHDVTRLLSSGPAQLSGLSDTKGALREGLDADLVVWDPEQTWVVTRDGVYFKNKETPYLGMTLKGKVYATIVRGNIVYKNGKFSEPQGKLLI